MTRARRIRRLDRFALLCCAVGLMPIAGCQANVDPLLTSGISAPSAAAMLPRGTLKASGNIETLKSGLDALSSRDVAQARAVRDSLPSDDLDRHILAWAIAMRGGDGVPSSDIAEASRVLAAWPGADTMRRNSERAVLRENADPQVVISAFGSTKPETVEGVTALARAHMVRGDTGAARTVLSPFWKTQRLEPAQETRIITEFGSVIPAADHRARMERMLYGDRIASAQRVADLADADALFDAWVAVIKGDRKAAALLDAVPSSQRSAGYLFAKARYLRKQEKFGEAVDIMLKAPKDRAALVDPDAWWLERRVLSRELLDKGDVKTAYKIVAAHAAESSINQADAEFHAGWYALRGLNDARTAAKHFARISEVAEGPISRSRAYYWLGRAAEAGGPGSAKEYYRKASAYGTTFYGQLAAAKIGGTSINVASPKPSASDRVDFSHRESVAAIRRLEQAGATGLAETLYRELAGQLTSPGELAQLSAMAEQRGNHFLALKIGKIAAARGIDVGSLAHPVGAIPASADISGSGKALAYAIARQESEFNIGAVSGAGARGLLQLMPGTAKSVAQKAGMAYSAERLTTDAGYNATLGAAFLGEQLDRFSGSYVLTFAGYNAGPRRAQEWIARYGDPRGKDVDTVVDWIERIPYAETRTYVQRVMENYQVYKMRLSGSFDIERDLRNGRS